MAQISCSECSRQVSDQASACPNCGAFIARRFQPPANAEMVTIGRSRSSAIVLALFLGALGGYKFYLDRPGWGVIYLLICWTFLPLVLSLIEALVYLAMSENDVQKKYSGLALSRAG